MSYSRPRKKIHHGTKDHADLVKMTFDQKHDNFQDLYGSMLGGTSSKFSGQCFDCWMIKELIHRGVSPEKVAAQLYHQPAIHKSSSNKII